MIPLARVGKPRAEVHVPLAHQSAHACKSFASRSCSSAGSRRDHPPPHFHVRYAEQKAIVAIDSLTVLEGHLSPRALGLVVEWASAHQQELIEDWRLAREQQPLKPVAPLE